MESIERLENVLNGEPVDRPPFSFWHHFGLQHMDGQAVASVHIAFARRFQTDFVKVMNDYPYPIRDGLSLDRMTDILQMRPLRGIEGSWSHQLLALKKIHESLGKEKWIVDTVYSPWTILGRFFGVDNVIKTAGSRPEIIKHGLDVITTSLVNYINEAAPYINGIYFSLTEADYSQFNPFEHYKICFPYNQAILEAAENKLRELKKKPFNILRLKGHRVFFESVKGYSSAAVSWEHFRTRPGLAKGLLAWKRPVLGGIDGETLHHGTPASIRDRFEKYSAEYLLKGLIIAPTCSLSTNVSPYLLEAITAGVNALAGINPENKRSSMREISKYPGMEREGHTDRFKKNDVITDISEEEEKRQFVTQLRADGRTDEAAAVEGEDQSAVKSAQSAPAAAGPADAAQSAVPAEERPAAERLFASDTDISALAAEAECTEPETEADARTSEKDRAAQDVRETELSETYGEEADMMPPDVELDDIDDIYADDFDIYDEDDVISEDEDIEDDRGEDADKPRRAWQEANRSADERGGSGGRRSERGARRETNGRYSRPAPGSRDHRGGYGERERRGGYGSRDTRGGYGERGRRGGYGSRDTRDGYGERERRGGYDSRDTRGGYGERERRGGYGSRDTRGGYGERERRGGYGSRDTRGGYGERERRGGYGSRDTRGGYGGSDYAGHTSRDGGRKVIRIRKQK